MLDERAAQPAFRQHPVTLPRHDPSRTGSRVMEMTHMFRKLVLAASAAAALGVSAIAFSAPSEARDWDQNGSVYDQRYDGQQHGHGYGYGGEHRRWGNDDYGYRRPHHGWGWGWNRPRPHFAFGYNPGWEQPRPYWAPRHRWFNDEDREW